MAGFDDFTAGILQLNGIMQQMVDKRTDLVRRSAAIDIDKMNRSFLQRASDPFAKDAITVDNWQQELAKHQQIVDDYITGLDFNPAKDIVRSDFSNTQTNIALNLTQAMSKQMADRVTSDGIVTREKIKQAGYSPEETFSRLSELNDSFKKSGLYAPKTIADWEIEDLHNQHLATVTQDKINAAGGDYTKAADLALADTSLDMNDRTLLAKNLQAAYVVQNAGYMQDLTSRLADLNHAWTADETAATMAEINNSGLSADDKAKLVPEVEKARFSDFYNDWLGQINQNIDNEKGLQTVKAGILEAAPEWGFQDGEVRRNALIDTINGRLTSLASPGVKKTIEEVRYDLESAMMTMAMKGAGNREIWDGPVTDLLLIAANKGDKRYAPIAADILQNKVPGWRTLMDGDTGYAMQLQRVMDWGKKRTDGQGMLAQKLIEQFHLNNPKATNAQLAQAADDILAPRDFATLQDWTKPFDQQTFAEFGGVENYFSRLSNPDQARIKYNAAIERAHATFQETTGFTASDEKSGKVIAAVNNLTGEPYYTVKDDKGNLTVYDPQIDAKTGKLGFAQRDAKTGEMIGWTPALEPGAKAAQAAQAKTATATKSANTSMVKQNATVSLTGLLGSPLLFPAQAEKYLKDGTFTEDEILALGSGAGVDAFKKKRGLK
jgi:hypothetical protein